MFHAFAVVYLVASSFQHLHQFSIIHMSSSGKNEATFVHYTKNSYTLQKVSYASEDEKNGKIRKLKKDKKKIFKSIYKPLDESGVSPASTDYFVPSDLLKQTTDFLSLIVRKATYGRETFDKVYILNRGSQGYAVFSKCNMVWSSHLVKQENGETVSTIVPQPDNAFRGFPLREDNNFFLGNSVFWELITVDDLESICVQSELIISEMRQKLEALLTRRYMEKYPGSEYLGTKHIKPSRGKFLKEIAFAVVRPTFQEPRSSRLERKDRRLGEKSPPPRFPSRENTEDSKSDLSENTCSNDQFADESDSLNSVATSSPRTKVPQ